MSDLESLRGVLSRMGTSGVPVEDETVATAAREDAVPRLALAIKTHSTRRRRGRYGAPLLIAAALAAAVALVALRPPPADVAIGDAACPVVFGDRGSVHIVSASTRRALAPGAQTFAQPGDVVETEPGGAARIGLTEALVVTASDSSVRIESLEPRSQRIYLDRGLVSVTVSSLAQGETFEVTTRDTRVSVHGTAFTVQSGEWTRVAVSSGVVSVHHRAENVTLRAGEHWSSEPVTAPAQGEPTLTATPQPASRHYHGDETRSAALAPPRQGVSRRGTSESSSQEPSSPRDDEVSGALSIQNDLFARAMAARKARRGAVALESLRQLLTSYPGGPIAHEARVEEMRVLRDMGDRAAAARAASRYLSAHPDGFAAAEARDLLGPGETR